LETTDREGEASIACTSGQEGWAKESSVKSMGCGLIGLLQKHKN
jgi:hypothetical protein